MIGSYGTAYKKGLIIKRNLFLLPSRDKGMEDAMQISGQFVQGEKKNGINLKMIWFQECFIGVKKKSLILY